MCLCDGARGSVCTMDYTMRPCLKENNYKTKQSRMPKGGRNLTMPSRCQIWKQKSTLKQTFEKRVKDQISHLETYMTDKDVQKKLGALVHEDCFAQVKSKHCREASFTRRLYSPLPTRAHGLGSCTLTGLIHTTLVSAMNPRPFLPFMWRSI